MKPPTVLLVTTMRWLPTARLAIALARAGFSVEAVCPSEHPIQKTTVVRRTFPYRGLRAINSVSAAIAATHPDLLVCGDDLSVKHLHSLYKLSLGASGAAIRGLIERSVGAPRHFDLIEDRASFMRVCEEAGVRVPRSAVINDPKDLDQWAAKYGFPLVLKANGTSGGEGVRIVRSADQARQALQRLQAAPFIARAVKRAVFDHNTTLLWPSILGRKTGISAQSFIPGTEATSAVACWKGEVVAGLHFQVLQKSDPEGPSTVLRRIAHPEMVSAVDKMVRRLELSGLHGFDFMLSHEHHDAYLIEINPRVTQVGHLSFGPGHDLPAGLLAALNGVAASPSPPVTENDVVALFPKEWLRDPTSPYLHSGYHDVPWDQAELVRDYLRKPARQGSRKRRATRR
ncbi:MAG: ATP-grasp domain-containing protein [Candidatus Acidiferrum sp.]